MNKTLTAVIAKIRFGTEEAKGKKKKKKDKLRFIRFSIKDQVLFAKRLALLVRAGVPILEGLRILKKTKSKKRNLMLEAVIKDVEKGKYLHVSLGRFKKVFGDFAINIIKVGEAGGILDQNLDYLAEELRKKNILRRKIISALVYPVFIMAATLMLTILLLIFVLPKIMPIFRSLDVRIPITTRALIFLSDFLVHYGIFVLLGLIILGTGFWYLKKKNDKFHLWVNRIALKIPLLGQIKMNYQMTNFCRTLGLLLKSGIRVNDAMNITADTTENFLFKQEYYKIGKAINKGKSLSGELEKNPNLFPEIMSQMIAIGEKTGELSETLIYLSEMYENEVDELTRNLSSALEPVLMVFMGVIVGFMAVSIITPIYEMTKNLTPR